MKQWRGEARRGEDRRGISRLLLLNRLLRDIVRRWHMHQIFFAALKADGTMILQHRNLDACLDLGMAVRRKMLRKRFANWSKQLSKASHDDFLRVAIAGCSIDRQSHQLQVE